MVMSIKLRFIGLGKDNKYQAFVKIYDDDNNLIFDNYTYDGYIIVNVVPNRVYRLVATFFSNTIITGFYSNRCEYTYIFSHAIYNRPITLSIEDYYYNLPIEKGVITLWQRQ